MKNLDNVLKRRTIVLDMSTISGYPLATLFGKTRRAVLGLLLPVPEKGFYLREINRLTGVSVGALQRELKTLVAAGLVVREGCFPRISYRADITSPIFTQLKTLFAGQSSPPAMPLPSRASRVDRNLEVPQGALDGFCRRNKISRLAFFGSVLRDDFDPDSDIDMLVEFLPEHVPGLFRMEELQDELSAMFGGRKVDLRTPAELNHLFRRQVENTSEVRFVQTG